MHLLTHESEIKMFDCIHLPDFTVLSTHIRVFNLLIQAILSAINHAGRGVTEWLRDTLHGGGVFVIDHPRGAGLDVAPLHTALFLAA